jgi:hypothetical protein
VGGGLGGKIVWVGTLLGHGLLSGWAKMVPRGLSSPFLFSFVFLFYFLLIFGLKNFCKTSVLNLANF